MLAPLIAALAATVPTANLNTLFADTLPTVKAKTSIPILYPDTMPSDFDKIYVAGGGSKKEYSLSLSAAPNGKYLRLTAKALGTGSADIRNIKVGTRVFAEGPYGAFTTMHQTKQNALLVAHVHQQIAQRRVGELRLGLDRPAREHAMGRARHRFAPERRLAHAELALEQQHRRAVGRRRQEGVDPFEFKRASDDHESELILTSGKPPYYGRLPAS